VTRIPQGYDLFWDDDAAAVGASESTRQRGVAKSNSRSLSERIWRWREIRCIRPLDIYPFVEIVPDDRSDVVTVVPNSTLHWSLDERWDGAESIMRSFLECAELAGVDVGGGGWTEQVDVVWSPAASFGSGPYRRQADAESRVVWREPRYRRYRRTLWFGPATRAAFGAVVQGPSAVASGGAHLSVLIGDLWYRVSLGTLRLRITEATQRTICDYVFGKRTILRLADSAGRELSSALGFAVAGRREVRLFPTTIALETIALKTVAAND
jgi:hypothetical protein